MQLRRRSHIEIFRTAALAAGAAIAALGYEGAPAMAQGYFPWDISDEPQIESRGESKRASQPRRAAPRKKIVRSEDETAGAPTAREIAPAIERPLFAVASIADQHVSIYNHHGLVARSAISTGMAGHSTPKGIFTIIGRERFHRSNIYSGAPMPFMQRITWSGIAMHLGVVPGHPASHGCIRLPAGFAAKLWGLTRIGERVVISPEDVTPTEFEHPLLPAPKMRAQTEGDKVATALDSSQTPPVAAEPPLINPQKYAEQLKVKAVAAATAAAKDVKAISATVSVLRQEAVRLATELRAAEAAHASTQPKFDAAASAYEAATAAAAVRQQESALAAAADAADGDGDGLGAAKAESLAKAYENAVAAKDAAALASTNAGAALSAAAAKLEAAKTASSAKDAELADAVRRLDEATAAAAAAANAEKEARRLTTAVSVLVSKKDRRIYVRQGLSHVFDAPIEVRDPETPLGTHLYVATATTEAGNSLKWSVVSMPVRAADEQRERRKNYAWAEENAGMPWTSRWSATPAEALERVEIAQDVRDRIAERLWKGASLIISDQPLSGETGNDGTDLTVKIR